MKFQTTLAFTLLLLIAMVGAGTVSALYGFTLGHNALQGVKQPESNPTQQLLRSHKEKTQSSGKVGIELISERQVLVSVYDQIYAKEQALKKGIQPPKQPKSSFVKSPDEPASNAANANAESLFPFITEVEKVSFEVANARLLGSYWVMDVSLSNSSRQSVRFLYNFLEIKDEQGRILSGQTEGLPGEIPANNQTYSGQIRIPSVILEQSQSISLQLKDYPNQAIALEIMDIPMVR